MTMTQETHSSSFHPKENKDKNNDNDHDHFNNTIPSSSFHSNGLLSLTSSTTNLTDTTYSSPFLSSNTLDTSSSSFLPTTTTTSNTPTSTPTTTPTPTPTTSYLEALDYINHELTLLGLPSPLHLVHPTSYDVSNTVNVIFMLLQQLHKEKKGRKEIEGRYQKLVSDYQAMELQSERHQEKLHSVERENKAIFWKL
ncbi:hypothetical protein HMI54_014604, partial [Coelomomyces lativittatus]